MKFLLMTLLSFSSPALASTCSPVKIEFFSDSLEGHLFDWGFEDTTGVFNGWVVVKDLDSNRYYPKRTIKYNHKVPVNYGLNTDSADLKEPNNGAGYELLLLRTDKKQDDYLSSLMKECAEKARPCYFLYLQDLGGETCVAGRKTIPFKPKLLKKYQPEIPSQKRIK